MQFHSAQKKRAVERSGSEDTLYSFTLQRRKELLRDLGQRTRYTVSLCPEEKSC